MNIPLGMSFFFVFYSYKLARFPDQPKIDPFGSRHIDPNWVTKYSYSYVSTDKNMGK